MILIALGGADGVWQELQQAQTLCPDADIGAVNEAGRDYHGSLKLWATLHPEKFGAWQRQRKGDSDYIACSHKAHFDARVDLVTNEIWSGTSGLFLIQVAAITFGYSHIIACGMPMVDQSHYFDNDGWEGASRYRRGWSEAIEQPELKNRVRSMSGWTRELAGEPTKSWLAVPTN